MRIKRNDIFLVVFAIFILVVGGLIYIIFRPHYLKMFTWLQFLNIDTSKLHLFDTSENIKILSFCIYSLPNALWAISAYIIFGLILKKDEKLFFIYSIIFTFINISFELFQYFKIIPGTFDFIDLAVLLISFLIGILIYKIIIRRVSDETKN